jgi:hypothetical protein
MNKNFSIKEWYSYSELDEYLRVQEEQGFEIIKIGRNNEGIEHLYSIFEPLPKLIISIYVSFKFDIVQNHNQNIVIGFDRWICWILRQDIISLITEDLVFVFYEFIRINDDEILVISEIDILKINFDHKIYWHIPLDDILVDFEIDDGKYLKISLMNNPSLYQFFDIKNGIEIKT